MKKIVLIFMYLSCCFTVLAQDAEQHKRDSMTALLANAKADTNKVKLLNKIGDEYAYNDIKKARGYYAAAFELSKQLDFTRGIIRYYSSEGELLNLEGKYTATIDLLRKGILLSTQRKDNMRLGIMYENIGNTFGLMQRLDSAMDYYLRSLGIFESFNDSTKMANVYTNLSSIFTQTDNQEKALLYADKALAISQQEKDGFYLSGLVNKSVILWKLKRYDESDQMNNEIIALATAQQDDVALADALQSFCNHSLERKQYDKLLAYAVQLVSVAGRLQSNDRTAVANYWMAAANYYKHDLARANLYIGPAIQQAEKDTNAIRMKECYVLYAKILLAKESNIELAEQYTHKADSIEQEILNKNILTTTHEIEAKYETGKKETRIQQQQKEIAERRKQNIILIISLFLVAAALLFFILWMRNRQRLLQQQKALQQQQIEQLEQEKQLAATRSVLKGQEEERSRLARDLHDGLGGILSSAKYSFNNMKERFILTEENASAFEKSMDMLDQSIAELRRVAHNMMPESLTKLSLNEALQDYCQQVTNSGALNITYQSFGMETVIVDNTIKTTVYRIVQEMTNNIIKHANATNTLVQLIAKDNFLNITIEDNGKGFDVAELEQVQGIGYKNTRNRIDFLKGKLDINSKLGEGTSVYIEIPL